MTQVTVPETAPAATSPVEKRIIPGAPPPTEKAAKKKRKPKAKTDEDGKSESVKPAPVDVTATEVPVSGSVEAQTSLEEKKSPVLDVLNKRIRNFTKKIQRVKEYQSKPESSLNEDQKKALASLPVLEGVLHELDDTKKAIEPLETRAAKDAALQRLEAENIAHTRTQQAVSEAKIDAAAIFATVLDLITQDTSSLSVEAQEQNALTSLIAHLTSSEPKEKVLSEIVKGEGDWEGFSYSQLIEISRRVTVDVAEPTVESNTNEVTDPVEQHIVEEEDAPAVTETDVDKPVGGISAAPSGALHFMLESELETQAPAAVIDGPSHDTPNTHVAEPDTNGLASTEESTHVQHSMEDPIPVPQVENIDWAADDGTDLPPINTLEAKFGASGEVTPEVQPEPEQHPPAEQPTSAQTQKAPPAEVDGFIPIQSRRGGGDRVFRGSERGRGRGGFRGGERGRGRGSYRGERGHRGGHRGGRSTAEQTTAA